MKILRTLTGTILLACAVPGYATVFVQVDMDPVTPGVQSERFSLPGDTFTATLLVTADAAGISSYGISVNFDTAELTLDGSPASTELLPAGFSFNFTPGVSVEDNSTGRVWTFEAGTFGPGAVSSTFSIGTIKYKVLTPLDDGLVDIDVGLFNTGVDGLFDSNGGAIAATYVGGKVLLAVPESSSFVLTGLGLVGLGLVGLGLARRRQKKVNWTARLAKP